MSRKHYKEIASVIAGETAPFRASPTRTNSIQYNTAANIARSVADMFKRDNARFDRARFYTACGLEEYQ